MIFIYILVSFGLGQQNCRINNHIVSTFVYESAILDSQRVVLLEFEQKHIDLGEVKKGEKRETAFTFTNRGNEDIKIELVSACECTTLDWPRRAIPPGGTGTIDIIFDSGQKDKSETIEVDIHLKNTDPKTGYPILEIVSYSYKLIE